MDKIKSIGTQTAPAVKILPISDVKITKDGDKTFLEGYANTKNSADRYGDIPTVFTEKRDYVYELKEYKKNPVVLIDHVNRIDHVAGSMTEISEDEKGLFFKAELSKSDFPIIKHAREVYVEGHAKGISIAGRFHFEDSKNPNNLTLAEIFEISLVAVPADSNSLAEAVKKALVIMEDEKDLKNKDKEIEEKKNKIFSALMQLESGQKLSADELRLLTTVQKTLNNSLGLNDPTKILSAIDELEN